MVIFRDNWVAKMKGGAKQKAVQKVIHRRDNRKSSSSIGGGAARLWVAPRVRNKSRANCNKREAHSCCKSSRLETT